MNAEQYMHEGRYHVFFYSIPVGTEFVHKGERYRKTGEEEAVELDNGKKWLFEIHYGVLIDELLPGVEFRPLN